MKDGRRIKDPDKGTAPFVRAKDHLRAIADENRKSNPETTTHQLPSPDPSTAGRIVTPNLKVFTFAELKKATRDFRPDTILGEGGFGRVFKGWVDENTYAPSRAGIGMAVAVKKSNPDSYQGQQEWQVIKFK